MGVTGEGGGEDGDRAAWAERLNGIRRKIRITHWFRFEWDVTSAPTKLNFPSTQ